MSRILISGSGLFTPRIPFPTRNWSHPLTRFSNNIRNNFGFLNRTRPGSIICFHKHNGDLEAGDLGIICSFGAGYSVGNIIVRRVAL